MKGGDKMKRLMILVVTIIMALSLVGCGVVPLSDIVPDLTFEEIELLEEHSYGGDCVARWATGSIIEVFDGTGFSQLEYVFDEWNDILDGNITLVTTNDSSGADVKIVFKDLQGFAGYANVGWNNYEIYTGLVEIDPDTGIENLIVYLHEFGHILGFHKHFEEGTMASTTELTYVDQKTKDYFSILYSVPIGYCF